MSKIKEYYMLTMDYIEDLLLTYFDGDTDKAELWMETPNPQLGGVRPINMITTGKIEKLKKFIEDAVIKQKGEL